ncbi:helix-turn-helix transcriptional regulator [Endozoicomonas sp. 8E]|uniref:helix-turn-helix domain-containing protein n=1 Tax=Endozoicomonas sp. 8E TaxID=3035692 RepID=UPI002938F9DE|nr:helix-turn-helix transcriptional regulator [Endozoicomonas sp. 8E]WOG26276.1 helix-turn-helix transcriptional regulator [Endozoicomonas sp. 8E]
MTRENKEKTAINRVVTDTHKARSARLKRIYQQKKAELGLTQERLQELAGFKNQSIVSQYMNAKVSLNTDAIIRFSRALQCKPEDIEPDIDLYYDEAEKASAYKELRFSQDGQKIGLPVIGTVSGQLATKTIVSVEGCTHQSVAIELDAPTEAWPESRGYAIVDPAETIVGAEKIAVMFRMRSGYHLFNLVSLHDDHLVVRSGSSQIELIKNQLSFLGKVLKIVK